MPAPGERIDTWIVECRLGAGGMGSVWLCHSQSSERFKAAVKVLDRAASAKGRARFAREAEILHSLDHPNVVRVLNLRLDWEPPYIAMEHVAGESLDDRLGRGPVALSAAVPMMRQLADAVAYLHARGVRHRDLKPSNVLIQGDDTVKLVDFGVALDPEGTRMTAEGVRIGTPAYAPPEWLGTEPVDPAAADLYALGVVFYELLTGRQPFPVDSSASRQDVLRLMLAKQAGGPLDPGDPVPRVLRDVVEQLTHGDPGRRLSAATVVKVLAGETIPPYRRAETTLEVPAGTPPPTASSTAPTVQVVSRPRRRPVRWAAAFGVSAGFGFVGVVAFGAVALRSTVLAPAGAPVPPPPLPVPEIAAVVVPPPPPAPPPEPVPPPAKPPPGGRLVTARAFRDWVERNPDWSREAAIARGVADEGYLTSLGTDGPATSVSWLAAAAYCETRGGLLPVGDPPLTWNNALVEWRVGDGGVPMWRDSVGQTSPKVGRAQSNQAAGFRCVRG